MSAMLWRFEALDTLFSRDGRPFNAGESAWIDSQFPPTGRVFQGAIRTAILTQLGADFDAFGAGKSSPYILNGRPLTEEIGTASDLGRLFLTGPFLTKNGALLFPAPLDLAQADSGFAMLSPGGAAHSDLGAVRLPRVDGGGRDTPKVKTQEGKYVAQDAMKELLAGHVTGIVPAQGRANSATGSLWPLYTDIPDSPALADREPKIGLARDNGKRKYKEGMLYSIAPVRPRDGVGLAMVVDGLDPSCRPSAPFCQHLGGERKLAQVTIDGPSTWPAMPSMSDRQGRIRFKLVLTTSANFNARWLPPGFEQIEQHGIIMWRGKLKDISCDIVSACIGKSVKIGGWDMVNNAPRPDEVFVPAGSVYFCEADASQESALRALHGKKIGEHTEYGFGHILIGTWEKHT